MQLTQLQYFCAVARCHNISRAAEELWISQSALSKAIIGLEAELGVQLFDRSGRNVRLNEAGRVYYRQVSYVLYLLNDAGNQVRSLKNAENKETSVVFFAANFISAWIREEFCRRYPQYPLRVYSYYAPGDFDPQETDFQIYATPIVPDGLDCQLLLEEELMLAFSKNHPLAAQQEIDMRETRDYPFQCLPVRENLHENLLLLCQHHDFVPNVALCTEDSFSYFDGLISSNLIALVPQYTAFPALIGDLALRPIKGERKTRSIYLASRRDSPKSQAAKVFQDFCIETFQELQEPGGLHSRDSLSPTE